MTNTEHEIELKSARDRGEREFRRKAVEEHKAALRQAAQEDRHLQVPMPAPIAPWLIWLGGTAAVLIAVFLGCAIALGLIDLMDMAVGGFR